MRATSNGSKSRGSADSAPGELALAVVASPLAGADAPFFMPPLVGPLAPFAGAGLGSLCIFIDSPLLARPAPPAPVRVLIDEDHSRVPLRARRSSGPVRGARG